MIAQDLSISVTLGGLCTLVTPVSKEVERGELRRKQMCTPSSQKNRKRVIEKVPSALFWPPGSCTGVHVLVCTDVKITNKKKTRKTRIEYHLQA